MHQACSLYGAISIPGKTPLGVTGTVWLCELLTPGRKRSPVHSINCFSSRASTPVGRHEQRQHHGTCVSGSCEGFLRVRRTDLPDNDERRSVAAHAHYGCGRVGALLHGCAPVAPFGRLRWRAEQSSEAERIRTVSVMENRETSLKRGSVRRPGDASSKVAVYWFSAASISPA